MRYFSKFGIVTIFTKFKTDLNINVLARAKYHKIGVIIDARCYDAQDILLLMTAVSEISMLYRFCFQREFIIWFIYKNSFTH